MEQEATGTRGLKVAVVGCTHGELDKMYETIEYMRAHQNIHVDLLLCCGDFQVCKLYSRIQQKFIQTSFLCRR